MALFSPYEIRSLKARYLSKTREEFTRKYADHIDDEIRYIASHMRDNSHTLYSSLLENITDDITVEVPVMSVHQFHFEDFVAKSWMYMTESNFTYRSYDAKTMCPGSFRTVNAITKQRSELWESDEFLSRLAKELELPDTFYFDMQSTEVPEEKRLYTPLKESMLNLVLVMNCRD